jgi:hypothetical protein
MRMRGIYCVLVKPSDASPILHALVEVSPRWFRTRECQKISPLPHFGQIPKLVLSHASWNFGGLLTRRKMDM